VAQKRADVPISIEIKREKDVIKIGIWEAHFPVRGPELDLVLQHRCTMV
jgi:hypothetical protein